MTLVSDREKTIRSVSKISGQKILVVGDVGLDEYVMGTVRRISPEAPVPIVEVDSEANCLGLASNVAANIASLGGVPILIGLIGQDQTAEVLKNLLKKNLCDPGNLVVDLERPTTRKLRVMAGHHHIVRVDFEKKKFLSSEMSEKLLKNVEMAMPNCDGVILEDYAKGVLSEATVAEIVTLAHKHGKLVTLDPNRATPAEYYKNVDYLTPNYEEALSLAGLKNESLQTLSDSLEEVGTAVLKRTSSLGVIITRGKDGMSVFLKEGTAKRQHIPTFARSVFDVTGAGDTVIAALTMALTAGLDVHDACVLANYAAGIVVGKAGCVTTTPQELVEYIQNL